MAYEPTVWQDGDIITAEKMNKIENGIATGGGGVLLVNVTESSGDSSGGTVVNSASPMLTAPIPSPTFTADKTYDEVEAAIDGNQTVIVKYQPEHTVIPGTETIYLTLKDARTLSGNGVNAKSFIFGGGGANVQYYIVISTDDIGVSELLDTIETEVTNTEIDGSTRTTYSKVDATYEGIFFNSNFDIKLLVRDTDKTMVYTMNEYYPNDGVIAFSGAGKVGPLYMDANGNISETYPTSGGSGGDPVE